MVDELIWACSADSHFLEPEDLWSERLPADLAARMPRSVRNEEKGIETVFVDGKSFERTLPSLGQREFAEETMRPPGARDARLRLKDLDGEGIWAELVFPSLGMWFNSLWNRDLVTAAVQANNDWAREAIEGVSGRFVVAYQLPMLSVVDAVTELERIVADGARAILLPVEPPVAQANYTSEVWEPLWDCAEAAGVVMGMHIGTESITFEDEIGVQFRGPGGAIRNYVESSFGAQRAITGLVAGGVLDRHPALRILVAEGGASWVPFLGDRMNEAYRQHGPRVRPKLSISPKEQLYRQVYASFQHDESAVDAAESMGYRNVLWGSDYPHQEGTFGHSQATLHELFDGRPSELRRRVTVDAFLELFPDVEPMTVAP